MVYVVGIGPGNRNYILPKAIEVLEKNDFIIGFSRAMDSLNFIEGNKIIVNSLNDIIEFLNVNKNYEIAIVASGDPTFFGIGEYIKKNYNGDVQVIPGISSFQYLTSNIGKSWNNGHTGSLHGREEDFIQKVQQNKLSIWLTDNKNNPSKLCERLIENNIKCTVIVGENLSYDDECITIDTPVNLINRNFSELAVVIVERDS